MGEDLTPPFTLLPLISVYRYRTIWTLLHRQKLLNSISRRRIQSKFCIVCNKIQI